jgi:hypothetical protein
LGLRALLIAVAHAHAFAMPSRTVRGATGKWLQKIALFIIAFFDVAKKVMYLNGGRATGQVPIIVEIWAAIA